MRKLRPESLAFTVLLGTLGALPPFGTDTALPALPQIAANLHATTASAAMTLSTFMLGFACAQLLFGPLSDRFGRKRVLLVGCALFTVASFACATAPTMAWLLWARLLEGCGAAAGMVMVQAIVRDCFEGAAGRTKLSFVVMVINVAPMIAPSIGVALLGIGDWRTIYMALGIGGALQMAWIAFGLGETLKPELRRALHPATIAQGYMEVIRHPQAFAYVLIRGFGFASLFAWISGSSFVMMQVFGLTTLQYGFAFAGTAASILFGSLLNGVLSKREVPPRRLLLAGLWLAATGSLALLVLVLLGLSQFWLLYPLLVLSVFSFGIITPQASHAAMQPMAHLAGVASATMGFVQMGCGALSAALVAMLADGRTATSMMAVMAMGAVLALLLYLWRIHAREAID